MIRRVRSLVLGALAIFGVPAAASASTLFDDNHCGERLVLCLDPNGGFPSGESKPDLRVGEQIHVIVIGHPIAGKTVSIDVGSVSSANSTLPKASLRMPPGGPAPAPQKLTEKIVTIPDADELILYVVQKQGGQVDISSRSLRIQDGLYFARAGLAFTWVDRGSRTITAEYSIIEKADFYPGVALTIWPWGHRKSTLSALEKRPKRRVAGDAFALQVGTDFDFTKPFDRAFFGITLEPISGLGISAGIAVTTGQFFSGAPPESAMAIVTHRMVRPYVSLTLTSELFDTIKSLAGKQREQNR